MIGLMMRCGARPAGAACTWPCSLRWSSPRGWFLVGVDRSDAYLHGRHE
ncbi:MAG: hypothetical protein R2695_22075 [Acidimicrobiales bacterium]